MDLSPFTLTLETDSQANTVDTTELSYLVSQHLLKEMQVQLPSVDTTNVDATVTSIANTKRGRYLQSGLMFLTDKAAAPEEYEFEVTGEAYFAEGSEVPTSESLETVTQESFVGASGSEFVNSLQNAEDTGLQSTRSISVDMSDEDDSAQKSSGGTEGTIMESYLGATSKNDDPLTGYPLYVLVVVFSVGLMLVGLYVVKTRKGRRLALENEMNAADSEVSFLLLLVNETCAPVVLCFT